MSDKKCCVCATGRGLVALDPDGEHLCKPCRSALLRALRATHAPTAKPVANPAKTSHGGEGARLEYTSTPDPHTGEPLYDIKPAPEPGALDVAALRAWSEDEARACEAREQPESAATLAEIARALAELEAARLRIADGAICYAAEVVKRRTAERILKALRREFDRKTLDHSNACARAAMRESERNTERRRAEQAERERDARQDRRSIFENLTEARAATEALRKGAAENVLEMRDRMEALAVDVLRELIRHPDCPPHSMAASIRGIVETSFNHEDRARVLAAAGGGG